MKTYGTLTYNKRNRCWDIKCEPHVAIRLKRVFAKIDTWQYGTLSISATVENCRDLQWFLERYPMEVFPWELLTERADKHRERQSIVEQLIAGKLTHEPFSLKIPPREYQTLAATMWLASGGLLLADDVGLGKTCSAIAGLSDPRTLPALVVTLSHLPIQWASEIGKFSDLTTHILKKGTPYDTLKYTGGKLPDVFICNYHKLAGWAETLAPIVKGVVFDEIQELRHRGTQKYNAAKHIAESCEFRLGTSATPIYNYGGEIWNILNVLTPDAIGTSDEFEREWCSTAFGDKVKIKDPAAFGLYARETGVMLRRTRIEVKRELPAITVVPHRIDVDPKVIQNMSGAAIELAKLILKQTQDFKGQKMQAAGEFDMKMRQATGIAKAPYVAEFVKFLVEDNDEPVVLFGWHREVYSIWMEKLKDLNPVMYTGSESPVQKEAAKKAFIDGKSKVMIVSLRAGAGMDGLQDVCHLGVFGELDWSPGVHEQCIGRIHRDGQDEPCTAYYLLSEEGSDPIMSDILGIKRQQIEGVRDPNQDLVTKLQIESDYISRLAKRFLEDHGIDTTQYEPTGTPSDLSSSRPEER
jgi:SNF2 family DNA or RNA helicase